MLLSKKISSIKRKLYARFEKKDSFFIFISSIFLYMSSAISLTLATKTIGYWLFDNNFSYTQIAVVSSILHLPYSIRILFAPWLEYLKIPLIKDWGYRKSLLFYINCINIGLIFIMSVIGMNNITLLFIVCFLCSMLSTANETLATGFFIQAYNVDLKHEWVQGGQIGYNVGLYITYNLLMGLSVIFSWESLYFAMIFILLINVFVIAYLKNCSFIRQSKPTLYKVYVEPVKSLYKRHREYFKPLLIFSLFYRAPDKILGPILPLFMVSLFGKTLSASLKTLGLLGMFIGSFAWKKFSNKHPIRGLFEISVLHMCNIIFLSIMSYVFLYTDYKIISAFLIACSGFLIKTIRTMESAAVFSYQCSLYDQKHFSAHSSIGTFADKAFGDLCAGLSGFIKDNMGFTAFFFISSAMVIPAWIASIRLSKTKMNLT